MTAHWWYSLDIAPQPWMVGLVRNSLRTALHRHQRHELADTACLLASEVVTNGIAHTHQPISVHMLWTNDRLRVSVRDASPWLPRVRRASEDDEGGRGLHLIQALASAWGVIREPYGPGKRVWFEVT